MIRIAPRFPSIFATKRFPRTTRAFSNTASTMVRTISDAVLEDHDELREYADKMFHTDDKDVLTKYQNLFTWELARHAVAEEIVIYPYFESLMGKTGLEYADEDRDDHQITKEQLYEFQSLKSADPKFKTLLKEIMDDMLPHLDKEEQRDMPALEAKLSPEESEKIGKSFERTKKFIPTKSHPSAPNKPPFETVAGFLAAPIDKLQNLFESFPSED